MFYRLSRRSRSRRMGRTAKLGIRSISRPSANYLGVAVWANGIAPFLLLVPMAWLLHWGIVLREEQYLASKFGIEYDEYRSRVRRWV